MHSSAGNSKGLERDGGGRMVLRLEGKLDRSQKPVLAASLTEARLAGAGELCVDLGEMRGFDSLGVAALLEGIGEGEKQGVRVRLRKVDPHLIDYLALVEVDRLLQPPQALPREPFLAHVGRIAQPFVDSLRSQVQLFGETLYWVFVGPFKKRGVRWDRVGLEISQVGANAVPIVLLISTLIGIILAIQAAAQLRQYGATIFIADLVGISITREIGPIITAIIVAGRSGSANAAEIGTMVVSEELDAIRQMGINPTRFLLVPKILALAIALPCLGMLADAVGIGASAIITTSTYDIGMAAYIEETKLALVPSDLYSGLFKCVVFGIIIGATGCGQGLSVKGGAGEVGRATTIAVVVSIFYIIATNTFFTLIFNQM